MVLKSLFVSDTSEDTQQVQCSGLSGYRALLVSTVIFRKCIELTGHLVVTLGEETLLRSSRTEIIELIGFYSEDNLEMTGH